MQEFLHALLQMPTLVFTGLLGVSLFYWLLIIIGAADLNPFDGAEGAVKGAVEGVAHAAADGLSEGIGEGLAEGAAAVKGVSAFTEALAFLGLTKVPVTISFSLFSLFGWFLSFATRHALDPVLPGWLSALAALGTGVVGGLAITSFLTRPLSGLFKESVRPGGQGLVGRTVVVTTERADASFGQGEIDDGAGGVTISIRTPAGVTLKRGDEAIVIDHDVDKGIYNVEPAKALLPDEKAAFEAAAREGVARSEEAREPAPHTSAPASSRKGS